MGLHKDLESLARDLDLSDLQYLLAQDSTGDEDGDLDLESLFPTVTQVEVNKSVRPSLPPEQVTSKKGFTFRSTGLWP